MAVRSSNRDFSFMEQPQVCPTSLPPIYSTNYVFYGVTPNRVLKNSFSSKKSCENSNKIEGQFSRTWLFQHPDKYPNQVCWSDSRSSTAIQRCKRERMAWQRLGLRQSFTALERGATFESSGGWPHFKTCRNVQCPSAYHATVFLICSLASSPAFQEVKRQQTVTAAA
jgi:hypothetical protein